MIIIIKVASSDEQALAPCVSGCDTFGGCTHLLPGVIHMHTEFSLMYVHAGSVIDSYEADFLCPVVGAMDMT